MTLRKLLRRFLMPATLRSVVYALKYKAYVSPKAEVDFTANLTLGRGAVISAFTKVKASDGPVQIGAGSSIGPGCFISSGTEGIRIGDHVMIAANTSLVANNHRYDRVDVPIALQGNSSVGIVVEDDVWIGCNCAVMDGSTIGTGAVIAAGSVVSGKVAPRWIAAGSPAKPVFERR